MSGLDFLSLDAREALERLIKRRVEEMVEHRLAEYDADRKRGHYMTIPEAAELLRCSRQRVDDLLSQRRLTRYKDGRRTLVSRAEIERHLDATTKTAGRGYVGRS